MRRTTLLVPQSVHQINGTSFAACGSKAEALESPPMVCFSVGDTSAPGTEQKREGGTEKKRKKQDRETEKDRRERNIEWSD